MGVSVAKINVVKNSQLRKNTILRIFINFIHVIIFIEFPTCFFETSRFLKVWYFIWTSNQGILNTTSPRLLHHLSTLRALTVLALPGALWRDEFGQICWGLNFEPTSDFLKSGQFGGFPPLSPNEWNLTQKVLQDLGSWGVQGSKRLAFTPQFTDRMKRVSFVSWSKCLELSENPSPDPEAWLRPP